MRRSRAAKTPRRHARGWDSPCTWWTCSLTSLQFVPSSCPASCCTARGGEARSLSRCATPQHLHGHLAGHVYVFFCLTTLPCTLRAPQPYKSLSPRRTASRCWGSKSLGAPEAASASVGHLQGVQSADSEALLQSRHNACFMIEDFVSHCCFLCEHENIRAGKGNVRKKNEKKTRMVYIWES